MVGLHGPANDLPGIEIDDRCQEQPALPGADIGDVRDPALVGSGRCEVLLQQIRGDRLVVVRIRGGDELAPGEYGDPGGFHQPLHALLAHRCAVCLQLMVDARTAIGLSALPMDGLDVDRQSPVLAPARAFAAITPHEVSRLGYLQHPAHGCQPPHGPVTFNEGILHGLSLAKNAAAFFRMSRSISSVRFSRSSLAFSASRAAFFPCPRKASAP